MTEEKIQEWLGVLRARKVSCIQVLHVLYTTDNRFICLDLGIESPYIDSLNREIINWFATNSLNIISGYSEESLWRRFAAAEPPVPSGVRYTWKRYRLEVLPSHTIRVVVLKEN